MQNLGLQAENEGLRGENERERLRQQQMINDMEKKMKELQEQLMSNVNNFIQARDAQATLRTEIDTYRTLLDQGQRRCSDVIYYSITLLDKAHRRYSHATQKHASISLAC